MFSTIDTALLTWLNHNLIPGSLPFLQAVSTITTYVSISIILATLIGSIINKSKKLRQYFYMLALVLILSAIGSPLLKSLIYRERPFLTHEHIEKRSTGGKSSFPSGHTMEAFAMAMAVSICYRRKAIVVAIFTWATLVGYSRIALGVHYPSDVLGGMIIGGFMGWLVPWFFGKWSALKDRKSKAQT